MSDLPIASAAVLTGATLASNDVLPVLDVSASAGSKGSKITVGELFTGRTATDLTANKLTLTALAGNAAVLASTGHLLTGSNATSMIDLAGTWNTSGNPTALLVDINNTQSGASSLLLDLKMSGVSKFNVAKSGLVTVASSAGQLSYAVNSNSNSGIGASNSGNIDFWSAGGIYASFDYIALAVNNGCKIGFSAQFSGSNHSGLIDAFFMRAGAAASVQMGGNHATTGIAQLFKAHDVTTGTGASLTLAGGKGSVAGGAVILATSATTGTATPRLTIDSAGLGTFSGAAFSLVNSTAASAGVQSASPSIVWTGQGWKTSTTAGSQTVDFRAFVLPVQGAAAPTAAWQLQQQVSGSGFANAAAIQNDGRLTLTGSINSSLANCASVNEFALVPYGSANLKFISAYGNFMLQIGGSGTPAWISPTHFFDGYGGGTGIGLDVSISSGAYYLQPQSAGVLGHGRNHATTPTAQTIKAHDVTTGTGASLTLAGGQGSVAGGAVILATSATTGTATPRLTIDAAGVSTFTPSANTQAIISTGYSLTGSNATSMIDLAGTWNTSGAPSAIKLAITETAAAADSAYFTILGGAAGTTPRFSINRVSSTATELRFGTSSISSPVLRDNYGSCIQFRRGDGNGGDLVGIGGSAANTGVVAFNTGGYLAWGGGSVPVSGANNLFLGQKGTAAAALQLGLDADSSQVSQIFSACGARIGTDNNTTPTNALTLAGPHCTGTGTGGDLRLGVYGSNGVSGTAMGTLNAVLTVVAARKVLNVSSIPTSSAGLSSGDVYSNAGVLTIVP